jgi:hypothetical protein
MLCRWGIVPDVSKNMKVLILGQKNSKTGLLNPEEEHDLEPTLLRTAKSMLLLDLPPGHAFVPHLPSYTRLNHVKTIGIPWTITLG